MIGAIGGKRGADGTSGSTGALYPRSAGVPWIGGTPKLYYPAGRATLGAVSSSFAVGNVYLVPFTVARNARVDRIATEVIAGAVAGSFLRVGLYDSDADFGPGALLADSGPLSAAVVGIKETIVDIALTAGRWYWAAYSVDTAGIGVPAVQNAANQQPFTPMAGKPSGQFGQTMSGALIRAIAFGALPNPAAPNTEHTGNSPVPAVWFRFSA